MGLTEYTTGDKALWNSGREYERERIVKLLKKRLAERCDCVSEKEKDDPDFWIEEEHWHYYYCPVRTIGFDFMGVIKGEAK